MEVLVFSTSVQSMAEVKTLEPLINTLVGNAKWNFALDDCDKILRIASHQVEPQNAIRLLNTQGYDCKELE